MANGACLSDNCVDGVCCASTSCPACQSCALDEMRSCSNIAKYTEDNFPANACTGTMSCDRLR